MVKTFAKKGKGGSATYYSSLINRNGKGKLIMPANGKWEACTRLIDEGENKGRVGLWVRYLGSDKKK